MKALEKDRSRRYQTVNALALDIGRHLNDEPVLAGPPSTLYRARKFVRRHRLGVTAAAVLLVTLAAFAVVTAMQAGRIALERDRANVEAATARQVSDFLVGLFRVSDPSEARGRSVTAREILDKGARDLAQLQSEPDVQARLQATIGTVYTSLGVYDAALPLVQQSVATRLRILGADHPDTLAATNDLANLYWHLERYTDAEPLFRDVIERRTRLLGAEHPDTLKVTYDLASLFGRQKRWVEAEQLQRLILAVQQRTLGTDHPDTLASLNNLGAYLRGLERLAEAAAIGAELVAARTRVLGVDHPSTILSTANLAVVHDLMGEHARAESLYIQSEERLRRVLGEAHRTTAQTRLNYSGLLFRQGRTAEAEQFALKAYEGFRVAVGDQSAGALASVRRLIAIYDGSKQSIKANQWREKESTQPAMR